MRVHKTDLAEITLIVSPEDALLLAKACMAAQRFSSGDTPQMAYCPILAQLFEAMAATFDVASQVVRMRQAVAAGDPLDSAA